jgi:hypothetical protein
MTQGHEGQYQPAARHSTTPPSHFNNVSFAAEVHRLVRLRPGSERQMNATKMYLARHLGATSSIGFSRDGLGTEFRAVEGEPLTMDVLTED